MKTLDDFNFKKHKVLVRVDFNVPLDNNFQVTDASRIRAVKPTLINILEDGGSCILMSHFGRPEGREEEYSLKHIVDKVSEIIGVKVKFVSDCIGKSAEDAASSLKPGELLLLENLRFYKEETKGDREFARKLSELGDFYVNDAFGAAHRAHASTTTIAEFFPENKCYGALMTKEIESINKVIKDSKPPVTAIIGGAKVSSKISVLENILDKVDHLIICGGMAFTFIKALGGNIGDSLVEEDKLDVALSILEKAREKNVAIHLPTDAVIANGFSESADTKVQSVDTIPSGWMGLDAGPKTNLLFESVVLRSKTILWNGPAGVFEMKPFSSGTVALGHAVAKATKNGAFSLVGGGDSVAAVKQFGLEKKMSYISTGGGALLEMLEGKTLPGVAAIAENS